MTKAFGYTTYHTLVVGDGGKHAASRARRVEQEVPTQIEYPPFSLEERVGPKAAVG